MSDLRRHLTSEERATLAALADILVPAGAGMPSAGDVGLAGEGGRVDRVLSLRPDLAAALPAALARWSWPLTEAGVESFAAHEPDAFFVLLQLVIAAYYIDPAVKARLGYAGQEALALPRSGIGAEDHLAAMMECPPRYRAVARTGERR
jgi:hypothetical protein